MNPNKLRIFSWLQEESLLPVFNSFNDPILSLNLESKFNDFSIHSDKLESVLEQAIPKAFQKLAVQHATAALGEEKSSFLSTWQPKLRITIPDASQDLVTSDVELDTIPYASQDLFTSNVEVDLPYSYPEAFNMTHASAEARFNALAPRFNTNGFDLFNLQEVMVSSSNMIDERVFTGIRYWDSMQNYNDYRTAVINFSTLFIGLQGSDLNFLMDYTNWDETGALFLFLKFLIPKLGPFLSARLILPLYKPGAFIDFLEAAIYESQRHTARSMWQNSVNERGVWATWYDSATREADAWEAAHREAVEWARRAAERGAAA